MEKQAFTREVLCAVVEQKLTNLITPLEIYKGDDKYNDEEVSVWFLRGSTNDYHEAVAFWIRAFQYVWEQSHASRGFVSSLLREENMRFREISHEDFTNLLEDYGGRLFRYDLRLRGAFQQAWLMCDEWNEQAVFASTDCEYVAFFWKTTA